MINIGLSINRRYVRKATIIFPKMFQFVSEETVNRERPMFAADAPSGGGQIKPLECLPRRAPRCSRHRALNRFEPLH